MIESTRGLSRIPFTRGDEDKLRSLTTWMSIYGILIAIGAAYALFLFILGALHDQFQWGILAQAIVAGLLAAWSLQGATAFHHVVATDSSDQNAIVMGLRKLYSLFLFKAIYILVGILLPIAALLAMVVMGTIRGR